MAASRIARMYRIHLRHARSKLPPGLHELDDDCWHEILLRVAHIARPRDGLALVTSNLRLINILGPALRELQALWPRTDAACQFMWHDLLCDHALTWLIRGKRPTIANSLSAQPVRLRVPARPLGRPRACVCACTSGDRQYIDQNTR